MKILRLAIVPLSVLYFAGDQSALAVGEQRLDTAQNNLEDIEKSVERLPPALEEAISGSGQNLSFLGSRFRDLRAGLGAATPLPAPPGVVFAPPAVSSPQDDRRFSQFAGFTQSSTSSAWCGLNSVVAYTDSGSFLETTISTLGGFSFVGFARSTNTTATTVIWTDKGFLNPGPTTTDTLGGDPVAVCTNASTFYIASLFFRDGTSDISVSKSTDGGNTFGTPISAVSKDVIVHFLDKPWMDSDPSNLSRIYVTYTDFDSSGGGGCGGAFRTAIELVRSDNGGVSWSAPTEVDEVCGSEVVQGSQVAVGPGGKVYVAWEFIGQDSVNDRAQFVASSTDLGVSFPLPPVQVAQVACVGSCGGSAPTLFGFDPQLLRGLFRSGLEFPSLAVNATNVYLTWHNARVYVQDSFSQNGYGFADIVFSKSTDGGASWSAPVRVNNNSETSGKESDQYQPAIAVNTANKLAICYYDRRSSFGIGGINSGFDRWCATSTNAGGSWSNLAKTSGPYAPTPDQDLLLNPFYFGDYDNLTTDGTGVNTQFLGASSETKHGNPDVTSLKL